MSLHKRDSRKLFSPQLRYGIFGPEAHVYCTETFEKVPAKVSTKWSADEFKRLRATALKPKPKPSNPVWNKNVIQKPKRGPPAAEKPPKPTKSKLSKASRPTKPQRVNTFTDRNLLPVQRKEAGQEAVKSSAKEKKKRLGKKKTRKGKKKQETAEDDDNTSGNESESSDRWSQKELEGQLVGLQDVVLELIRQYPRMQLQAKVIMNQNPVLRKLPLMLKLKSGPLTCGDADVEEMSSDYNQEESTGSMLGAELKPSQAVRTQSYMYSRNEALLKKVYGES